MLASAAAAARRLPAASSRPCGILRNFPQFSQPARFPVSSALASPCFHQFSRSIGFSRKKISSPAVAPSAASAPAATAFEENFTAVSSEIAELEERPLLDGLSALEVNSSGSLVEIVYNRRDLARRFGLHQRDLRFLDSSLRNLPSILARKKVIIVNLELLKAIISADSVILFDFHHSPQHLHTLIGHIQKNIKSEPLVTGEEKLPFELIALECILTSLCRNLETRFESFASALGSLLGNATAATLNEGSTLMHLLQLKNGLTAFEVVLKESGQAIREILESDEDMSAMFLTAKKAGSPQQVEQHGDVELILETYLRKVDELENEVKTDVKSITLTEEHIQIRLDTARNAIMKLELLVSIGTFGIAVSALGAGVMGMNLDNHLEHTPFGVYAAAATCGVLGVLSARAALRLTRRHKVDLFHIDSDEPKLELPVFNKKRNRFTSSNGNGNGGGSGFAYLQNSGPGNSKAPGAH